MKAKSIFSLGCIIAMLAMTLSAIAAIGIGESPLFSLNTTYNATQPEFEVRSEDISISNIGGGQYRIVALVWNYGTPANDAVVRFVQTDLTIPNGVETVITTLTIPHIGQDSSAACSTIWTPLTAYERIRVIADPNNVVVEYREYDNAGEKMFGGSGTGAPVIESLTADWDADPRDDYAGSYIRGIFFQNAFKVIATDPDGPSDIADVQFYYEGHNCTSDTMINGEFFCRIPMDVFEGEIGQVKAVAHDQSGLASDTAMLNITLRTMPPWLLSWLQADESCVKGSFNDGVYTITFESECELVDTVGYGVRVPDDVDFLEGKKCDVSMSYQIGLSYDMVDDVATLFGGAEWTREEILNVPFLQRRDGRHQSASAGFGFSGSMDPVDWHFVAAEFSGKVGVDAKIPAVRAFVNLWPIPPINGLLEITFQVAGQVTDTIHFQLENPEDPNSRIVIGEPTVIRPEVDFGVSIVFKAEICFVAGVAVSATPTLLIAFPIRYTTADGASYEFTMYFEIPWEVYAYLQLGPWYQNKWEIGSGVWGPWNIVEGQLLRLREGRELSVNWPDLLASPSLATDNMGNATLVWIGNSDNVGGIQPHVYFSKWDGIIWSDPDTLSQGSYGRLDPYVTYAGSNPVAIWTENRISDVDSSTTMDEIMTEQEIYASEWSTGGWQTPIALTYDALPDGKASVSVSPTGRKLATWLHCTDNMWTTTTDAEIYYDFQVNGTWDTPHALTNNSEADWNCRTTFLSDTQAIAVWVRELNTNDSIETDKRFIYTVWDSVLGWSTEQTINTIGGGPIQGSSLTTTPSGKAVLAWVGVLSIADTLNYWSILASTFNPEANVWSDPDTIHTDIQQISEPNVKATDIDGQDVVQVVWRGFYSAHEDFFISLKNLDAGQDWTEPHNLTEDDFTDWMAASAIDANQNTLLVNVTSDLDSKNKSLHHGNLANDLNFKAMGIEKDLRLDPELNFGMLQIAPDIYTHDTLITFAQGAEDSIIFADMDSTVTISVLLKNQGVLPTTATPVEFWCGHPDSTGSVLIGMVSAPVLQPDSTGIITRTWTATPGVHDIYVWLDPDSTTQDRNRYNNRRYTQISVVPDLTVTQVYASNANPDPADTVFINAIIANPGGANTDAFNVVFSNGHPDSASSTRLDCVIVSSLSHLAADTVAIQYIAVGGTHDLWAVINPGTMIEEDTTNNRNHFLLKVLTDLAVYNESMTATQPDWSMTSTASAIIHNDGGLDAEDVLVFFYAGNPLLGGTIIDSALISDISARDSAEAEISWHNTPLGLTVLYVSVDPHDAIEERDINNNKASHDVVLVALPDLVVESEDFHLNPPQPWLGDTVHMTVVVRNTGIGDALNNVVRVYQDYPDSLNRCLLNGILYTIEENGQDSLDFTWCTDTLSEGVHMLWLQADPESIVTEGSDSNNVIAFGVVLIGEPIRLVVSYPSSDTIRLDWNSVPGVTEYKVYRDSVFWFEPTPEKLIGTTSDTLFFDPGITARTTARSYYVVTASSGQNPPSIIARSRQEDYRIDKR